MLSFLTSCLLIAVCLAVDIPPEGVYFRLGSMLEPVFITAVSPNQVVSLPQHGDDDSQYWTVDSPDLPEYEGFFRLKNKRFQTVIVASSNGIVSAIPSYHVIPEQFWKIDSPDSGSFQLLNKQSSFIIFHMSHGIFAQLPENIPPNSGQNWQFSFEEFHIDSISFDYNQGSIVGQKPLAVATMFCDNQNGGSEPSKCSFIVDETVTHSTHFSHTSGVELKIGAKFSTGIPFVANGEISTELGLSQEFEWGKDKSVSQSLKGQFEIVAGQGEIVKGEAVVWSGTMEVPYIMKMKIRNRNIYFESSGMWYGVSAWDLRLTTTLMN